MSTHTLSFEEMTPEQRPLAGGKGGSLARLYQSGFPVPAGFVILPCAFEGEDILPQAWTEVRQRLATLRALDPDGSFAVRSSALSEDSASASFAGEFETVLNVRAEADILQAVQAVYQSRKSERVQAYSRARGLDGAHDIAVVVQQLVKAEGSGVLFTANPITGRRDQAMLTAAWGLGEAIVGGLVTPDTLVIEKSTGRVLTREIADKQVMTVLLGSGTEERPVPENIRRLPVLSDAQASELAALGERVEALYEMPMDVEWVSTGEKVLLVQARPITTLPAGPAAGLACPPASCLPEPPPPAAWKLPKGQYAAMRNNIVELMPNPLTPLFDTLGREAINASLGRLAAYFLGRPDIMPDEIIITVNGYAYNNGSISPWKALGLFLNAAGIMKRMFTGALERWTEAGRPGYLEAIEKQSRRPLESLSSVELLDAAGELYDAAITAYGALISGVIPASWMTEALFTKYYNVFVRRGGDPPAQTFLLGFDSAPILAEKELFDLAQWARLHPGLAAYLSGTPAADLAARLEGEAAPSGIDADDWREWQARFQEYLRRCGHAIYDLDFANPVPADDPTPLLETFRLFARGQGANPYTRQQCAVERREQAQQAFEKRLKGLRLKYYRRFLAMAQRYAPLREDGLADVGLGYPLLRRMLRELGKRFNAAGLIDAPDDVYWLSKTEAARAGTSLDAGETISSLADVVVQRKAAWRSVKRSAPPMMLPQMKLFGVDLAELKSGRRHEQKGSLIKGVAASPGTVTAPACVLRGLEDFSLMKPGDVLVAAITTPAWTPLFARAAAVVTDVGGPLSHGSIVAREYGIPAVLGTGVATHRIRTGQLVTVDGTRGTVLLA